MKNLINLLLAKVSRAFKNISLKMESRTDTSVLLAPYAYRRFVYNYENLGPSLNNRLTSSVDILPFGECVYAGISSRILLPFHES